MNLQYGIVVAALLTIVYCQALHFCGEKQLGQIDMT
jgi:hypothetical protein